MTQRTIRLPKSIYTLGTILRADKRDDHPAGFFEIAGTLGILALFSCVLLQAAKLLTAVIGAVVYGIVNGRSFSSLAEAYGYGSVTVAAICLVSFCLVKLCKGLRFVSVT
jgi:hypothetical protein